jgi:hypothetical protein
VPLPPYDFEIGFAESKEGKLNTAKGYIENFAYHYVCGLV